MLTTRYIPPVMALLCLFLSMAPKRLAGAEPDRDWVALFENCLDRGDMNSAYAILEQFLNSVDGAWNNGKNRESFRRLVFSLTRMEWNKGIDRLSAEDLSFLHLRYRLCRLILLFGNSVPKDVLQRSICVLLMQNEYLQYILSERGDTSIREYLQTLVFAYISISAEIDVDFVHKREVSINMLVPGEPKYPAGVSPESVKEPAARAAYIKVLNEQREYMVYASKQGFFRGICSSFSKDLKSTIENMGKHKRGIEEVGRIAEQLKSVPGLSGTVTNGREKR